MSLKVKEAPPAIAPPSSGELQQLWELASMDLVRQINHRHHPWRKVRAIANENRLDPQLVWAAAKFARDQTRRTLDLLQPDGEEFSFCAGSYIDEQLSLIDRYMAGQLQVDDSTRAILDDEDQRRRIVIRSLMEEAIHSSILEGAATTREKAKDLLESGRKPKGSHERMVLNNYLAMRFVKEHLGEPLSVSFLHELHEVLTHETLEPEKVGRFRVSSDDVAVVDDATADILWTPPDASDLPSDLEDLCHWANTELTGERFVHPILKAIILHFMIGYLHPYCDGNGRVARALFYWSALSQGYWLFEFVVLSELIRKASTGYTHAYQHSEMDGGDLTYFIHYHLKQIAQAWRSFEQYVGGEARSLERVSELVRSLPQLNSRQRQLLVELLERPGGRHSVKSYCTVHGISAPTGRADLRALVEDGFLVPVRDVRRTVLYVPAAGLAQRVGKLLSEKDVLAETPPD